MNGKTREKGNTEGSSRWEEIFAGLECDYTMGIICSTSYSLSRSMAGALKDLEGKIVCHLGSGYRTMVLA